MKLKFIKDRTGCFGRTFIKDSEIEYSSWKHKWQGMTEPQRVKKNIFVFCYGMGEFDVFRADDVVTYD